MFVAGLTGGIGSGKSAVARLLQEQGIVAIDADQVARDVVAPGEPALGKIVERFGVEILQPDGALDRAGLRQIVFATPEARLWLESLLHPLIRQRIQTSLQGATSAYSLLVSPLLLETDQHKLVDYVVVVDVPEEIQLQRTTERDQNSTDQVKRIMAAQMDRQSRLARADSIIDNSGNLQSLRAATLQLHKTLLQRVQDSRDS
ncbi:dephospho-CoA kinase [Marinobacterium sedimentorum]|uniref:dephospho-CoA kinase n=1 Tax=Marinobacterium sedimentorum TaxID=2927804 RepID=UPI0020C6834F|nr:dephospho-CoA kinase [Marinobacterium sedimentorum]MCP8689566.1 dephospho-CoA kinase [Marinobacterium sedimentorum]